MGESCFLNFVMGSATCTLPIADDFSLTSSAASEYTELFYREEDFFDGISSEYAEDDLFMDFLREVEWTALLRLLPLSFCLSLLSLELVRTEEY